MASAAKASSARRVDSYWHATRHPLVCVVFVLPLLAAYEIGMHLIGEPGGASPRNGADVWLRDLFTSWGLTASIAAPALVLSVLVGWGLWRRQPLPDDIVGTGLGMVVESVVFAVGLLGVSQALLPLIGMLQQSGLVADVASPGRWSIDPACQQILRYLGAGLYEETIFRLLLFSGLWWLFLCWHMPAGMAFLLACFVSAVSFAGAHHVGVHGEPFRMLVFLFRTLAGAYFTWLFCFRGFGIAVGAHAVYDVLVGVLLR